METPKKQWNKQRLKKLFNGEKCGICGKRAQGIKYNAISCDSCRVFFRRMVLLKDTYTRRNEPFDQKCTSLAVCLMPGDLERRLKCQHCRTQMCYNAGMKDDYVQGSIAFGDSRTNRRRRKDSTKVDTSLVSEENRNGTTIMLTLRENIGSALNPGHRQNGDSRQSIIQHGQNGHHDGQNGYNINGLNGNSLNRNHHNGQNGYNFNNHSNGNSLDHLNGHSSGYQNGHNDHHLNFEERVPPPMRHLSAPNMSSLLVQFWRNYTSESKGHLFAKFQTPVDDESKLSSIAHFRDSLNMHSVQLTALVKLFPDFSDYFSHEETLPIVMKCYVEAIVLRWVVSFNMEKGTLRGLSGLDYKFSDICDIGSSWAAYFNDYMQVAQRIAQVEPDELDLALTLGLITLTADRHDNFNQTQRHFITQLQEECAHALWLKCRNESNRKKFYVIINELTTLRTKVREVDLCQVTQYRRRVILKKDTSIDNTSVAMAH